MQLYYLIACWRLINSGSIAISLLGPWLAFYGIVGRAAEPRLISGIVLFIWLTLLVGSMLLGGVFNDSTWFPIAMLETRAFVFCAAGSVYALLNAHAGLIEPERKRWLISTLILWLLGGLGVITFVWGIGDEARWGVWLSA